MLCRDLIARGRCARPHEIAPWLMRRVRTDTDARSLSRQYHAALSVLDLPQSPRDVISRASFQRCTGASLFCVDARSRSTCKI